MKAHNLAFSWHSPLPSCNSPKVAKKTSFILGEKHPYKLGPKPIGTNGVPSLVTGSRSAKPDTIMKKLRPFLQLQAQWSALSRQTQIWSLGVETPFSKWLMVVCQLTMVFSNDKHASNRSRGSFLHDLANWRKLLNFGWAGCNGRTNQRWEINRCARSILLV